MRGGLTFRMAFASALLTLIVAAGFGTLLFAIRSVIDSTQSRRDTRQVLVAGDALEAVVIDLETGVRGFVITGQERFLQPWTQARATFPEKEIGRAHV